jgi:TolB-like protein
VGLAYLAGVWLLLQVADTVLSNFDSPTWIIQALIFASALGFPVVLILAWLFELTPEGVVAEADLQAHKTVKFTGRRIDFAIIGLLVLAVGFLVSGNLLVDRPEIFADGEQPSIAVLPFVNMSSDSEQEYFSDGISEELLNLLAQVPNFRVISRSSSFAFKGQAIDIPTVAEQLNVHHVLEGSVRKSGDYVRITVQLIDARSDTNLWSETYDRTLENIFAVQDEIAASVLEQLQITLLGASPHRNEIETEAYTLLLRARYILNERLQESYPVADAALREALEIDPDFADAMIELGRLRHSEGSRGIRPQEEGIRLASELMEEALNVEPDNGHAYAWLGFLSRRYDDDIAAAAKYTERALALDPTNTEILGGVIGMLKVLDHLDESIVIGEYVVTHDPLCVNTVIKGRGRGGAGRVSAD